MNISIKCRNDNDIAKFGKGRGFRVSPLVPLVRKRILAFALQTLDNMPKDVAKSFAEKEFDLKNPLQILTGCISWIDEQGLLEDLIALIICPVDVREKDKDVSEIAEFLNNNASMKEEVQAITDFFVSSELGEIRELFLKSYTTIREALQAPTIESLKS